MSGRNEFDQISNPVYIATIRIALSPSVPPSACAERTCPATIASGITGIFIPPRRPRPRLRAICVDLLVFRPGFERLFFPVFFFPCCQRQRGFDGPHAFFFRAIHLATLLTATTIRSTASSRNKRSFL